MSTPEFDYTVFTDGCCLGGFTGAGGWAYRLTDNRVRFTTEAFGGVAASTANAMELTAAVNALRQVPAGASVEVHVDSRYVYDPINQDRLATWLGSGWRTAGGKPVANQALWAELAWLIAERRVTFTWTRAEGRADCPAVDALARRGAREAR